VNEIICKTKSECISAIKQLQFPVVMKIVGPIHKSDVGGIILNITSEEELITSFDTIIKIEGATSVLLQPMKKGTELFIGAKKEGDFGHLVLCGLGGIFIEVLKDIQTCLAPVSKSEAIEMIQNLKSYKIIQGVRNQEGINKNEFAEIITKVSNLVTIAPEIMELDLNPLLGNSKEIFAVDARIRIEKK
uniref:acetate--CoA ligase family protein n=1 Tax=Lutibacter sp. TaxID=1925666 RepID=UPI00356347B3